MAALTNGMEELRLEEIIDAPAELGAIPKKTSSSVKGENVVEDDSTSTPENASLTTSKKNNRRRERRIKQKQKQQQMEQHNYHYLNQTQHPCFCHRQCIAVSLMTTIPTTPLPSVSAIKAIATTAPRNK